MPRSYFVIKRSYDLVLAGTALLCLAPLLLPIMAVLRFTGEGWVFYRQDRVGHNRRKLRLLKFATMLLDSPRTGEVTSENDPRVLPLGKWLRATKINELPQLANIVGGTMSLVGPRPLTASGFELYPGEVQNAIAAMKPGLTGIGSLVFRNEERILTRSGKEKMLCYREDIIPLKGALEAWYHRNRSTMLDLRIVLYTTILVLFPRSRVHFRLPGIEDLVRRSTLSDYFGAG